MRGARHASRIALVVAALACAGAGDPGSTAARTQRVQEVLHLGAPSRGAGDPQILRVLEDFRTAQRTRRLWLEPVVVRRALDDAIARRPLMPREISGLHGLRLGRTDELTHPDEMRIRGALLWHGLTTVRGWPAEEVIASCEAAEAGWLQSVDVLGRSLAAGDRAAALPVFARVVRPLVPLYERPVPRSPPRPASPLGLLLVLLIGGFAWRRHRAAAREASLPPDLIQALGLLATRPADALGRFQAALPRHSAHAPEIRCHIVRCLLRQGQPELALEALKAIDPAKAPPRPLYLLARDLEERSQRKAALEILARLYLETADFEDVRERYERLRAASSLPAAILSIEDLAARLPARYSNVRRLGEGGMGIVLLAHDSELGRDVALKVIAPLVAEDPQFVRRFRREVRALTALDHESVIRILNGQLTPFPYYAMEYFEALTLRQLLKGSRLGGARVAAIAAQAAGALAAAHAKGIAHRDVKPDNMLVGAGDQLKLLDFGLAQIEGGTSLTQTGITAGSVPYMAPEQLRGDKVGPAADVYALGLVMHEMVTGRHPFAGVDPLHRLAAPPTRLARDPIMGEVLSDLVGRCTRVKPTERPTADAVEGELARALAALAAPASKELP